MDSDNLGRRESTGGSRRALPSDDYFTVADEDLRQPHSVLTALGRRVVPFGGIKSQA